MHRSLILCCLLFAACAQTGSEVAAVAVPEPVVEPAEAPEPVAETVEETPPPVPAPKPAPPAIPLEKLIGLEDDMVAALIGQPARREDRAPGVVWIYEASACRFGLLLYPDLETNHRTVLSYETDQPEGCAADMVSP